MNDRGALGRRELAAFIWRVAAGAGLASAGVTGVLNGNVRAAVVGWPGAPGSGQDIAPEDMAIVEGIQDVVTRRAMARATQDRELFVSTIDQRNLVWRRVQSETFENWVRTGRRDKDTYTVMRIQPKQDGYYKAWIQVTPEGRQEPQLEVVWVFRLAEQGWLHTEILNEEIGVRLSRRSEHFSFLYYNWDEDVIERIMSTSESAFQRVTIKLEKVPEVLAVMNVNPTFGSHSLLRELGVGAMYLPDTKTTMLIRSIESYGLGTTAIGVPPEVELYPTVVHELTHLVNDHIVPTVKLPKWMVEGLAEYVSENLRAASVRNAIRTGKQLTLDKSDDIITWGQDGGRGYTNQDIDSAYGHSAHAVTLFMERFGNLKFWELARDFAESRRWEVSFQKVTGIGWSQFESEFAAWLPGRVMA